MPVMNSADIDAAGGALKSSVGFSAALLGGSNAATNVSILQAAVNQARDAGGGKVLVLAAGTFQINNTVLLDSDIEYIFGPSTRIFLASGSNTQLFRNRNWNSPVKSVTSIASTAATFPPHTFDITVTATAHGFAVGDYVLIKGDTSEQYVGVHRVDAVPSPDTFQFTRGSWNAFGPGTGTMTVAKADKNITITGGIFDYNGKVNGASGLTTMAVIFNKIGNLLVRNHTFLHATKYFYYTGNSYGMTFRDCWYDTSSAAIQGIGPMRDTLMENVCGYAGDDAIAYTATNSNGYSDYDIPDCNGELINFTARSCKCYSGSGAFALYVETGFVWRNIRLEDTTVTPRVSHFLKIAGITGGAQPEDLVVDGVNGATASHLIDIGNGTDGGTFGSMILKGIQPDGNFRVGTYINIRENWTIKYIGVSETTFLWNVATAAGYGINTSASTVLKYVAMDNIVTDTTGGTTFSGVLVQGSQVEEMSFSNSALAGAGFAGLWRSTSSVQIPIIWATNLRLGSATGGIFALMQQGYSYRINLDRIATHGSFTFGNPLINVFASTGTYTIRARDMGATTVALLPASPNAGATINFSGDETAPVDITKITRVNGAIAFNSNTTANNGTDGAVGAGLFVSVGTAAGSWKRMGTSGGAGNQY